MFHSRVSARINIKLNMRKISIFGFIGRKKEKKSITQIKRRRLLVVSARTTRKF